MAKVLFRAYPVSSHYNATFKIANALKERYGHRIIYFGNDEFSEAVRANGHEYLYVSTYYQKIPATALSNLATRQYPGPKTLNIRQKVNVVQFLLNKCRIRQYVISAQKMKLETSNEFTKLCEELKPDFVFIDTFYDYEMPLLYKNKIPFVVYQTKFSSNKERNIPPLTSRFVPSNNHLSMLHSEILWVGYKVNYYVKRAKDLLFYTGNGPLNTFYKIVQKLSFPETLLYTNRSFNPGFTNTWEFVLSPVEMDFRRRKCPFQVTMSPVVDLQRKDTDYDYSFLHFKEHFLTANRRQQIIYCSLGSISTTHSRHCASFYKKLMSVVNKEKNYLLVLSIGFTYDISEFNILSDNVHVFQKVPQLEMLKHSDLMITHGGMQSITECVLSAVPMLVYPLNDNWDQNGNSARVIYHKLGSRGNIRWDGKRIIEKRIDSILKTSEYRDNVKLMGKRMRENRSFDEGISLLNSLISNQR